MDIVNVSNNMRVESGNSANNVVYSESQELVVNDVESVELDSFEDALNKEGNRDEFTRHAKFLAEEKKEEKIKEAAEILNKLLGKRNQKIEISRHDFFNQDIMIKITDKSTGDTVVEIPPKKILDMVAKLCDMAGVLIDKKV